MSSGSKMKWNGNAVKAAISDVAEEALWLAGQDLITVATNKVPIDTGTLRRSATVTSDELPNGSEVYSTAKAGGKMETSPSGKSIEKKVYVSYNTPYAIRLHESPDWHPRAWKRTASGNVVEKPAVGGWKWMEKSLTTITRRCSRGVYMARAKAKAGVK